MDWVWASRGDGESRRHNARQTGVTSLRQDIQGIRGIAVLLVVLFHAGLPWLPGGFVGVDVFFVISGYLISGLLLKDIELRGRIELVGFFARRAKRLLPAAIVLLCTVIAVTPLIYPPHEQREWLSAARAASIYLSNLWLAGRALDYFAAETHGNPLLHTWSLAVEEQFYLFWPLLLLLLLRLAPRQRGKQWLGIGIAVVACISFAACLWWTQRAQPWAFFGMPLRAWEFALGALVALRPGAAFVKLPPALASWSGLALVAVAATALQQSDAFPGYRAALPAVGTALLLLGLQRPAQTAGMSALLSSPPLARLGDLSYSWYLWHWPLLVWAAVLWPQATSWHRVAAVVLSLSLAWASLRWVENPIRHARFVGFSHGQVLATGVAGSLLVAVLAAAVMHLPWAQSGERAERVQRFEMAVDDKARIYAQGCHLYFFATEPRVCSFGPADATHTVVLLGDSHAAQWFPALELLAERWHWRLITMTKAACPALDLATHNPALRREYVECQQWRDQALNKIAALQPDLLVLASANTYAATPVQRGQALARVLTALEQRVGAALVLRDTPRPGFNVPSCLARAAWRGVPANCFYARDDEAVWHEDRASAERAAIAGMAQAHYLDLSNVLCLASPCEVLRDGKVMFSDGHHLSASFVAGLADSLEQAMKRALAKNMPLFPGATGTSERRMKIVAK